jgi:hypothetical protein
LGVQILNPRKQFVKDLHCAVAGLIANNEKVMILGDFNETLGVDPRMMASLCASHDLCDVLALFHGQDVKIPTYARGTKRLDYCLSSASLEGLITACGYNLFNEYIHCDHRAMFLDIRLKAFLGHGTPKLASPDLRFVSSASPDVKTFVRKMFSHLHENKVFHQYQEFRLDTDECMPILGMHSKWQKPPAIKNSSHPGPRNYTLRA